MERTSLTMRITATGVDRERLVGIFDQLGAEFMARQGEGSHLLDHSVAADLGRSTFEIGVTTEAETEDEARNLAIRYVEEVLAASGGRHSGGDLSSLFSERTITQLELVSA